MKRILGILAALTLLIAILAGCGDETKDGSAFVGGWKAESIVLGGTTLNLKDYAQKTGAQEGDDTDIVVTLQGDGKYVIDAFGKSAEGTWKEEGGKASITAEGQTQTAELQDGKLVLGEGETSIVFVKQNS